MGERILLINPIKKRTPTNKTSRKRKKPMATSRKSRRKAPRTAKQRAATRKLVALNRRRFKKNPTPRKRITARRRRRNPTTQPGRPSAYRRAYLATAPRQNPVRRRRRKSYKRNPTVKGIFTLGAKMAAQSAIAGAGAVGMDVAWGYLGPRLPAMLQAGPAKYVSKGFGSIIFAWLAGMVVKPQTAQALGVGALTVVMRDAMRDALINMAPQVKIDGMGYYANMGYYNPALPAGNNAQLGNYYAASGVQGAMPSGTYGVTPVNNKYSSEMGYYAQR